MVAPKIEFVSFSGGYKAAGATVKASLSSEWDQDALHAKAVLDANGLAEQISIINAYLSANGLELKHNEAPSFSAQTPTLHI